MVTTLKNWKLLPGKIVWVYASKLVACMYHPLDKLYWFQSDLSLFTSLFRNVRKSDQPFGGIQLIVSGDFLQLPPVAKGSNKARFCFQVRNIQPTFLEIMLLSSLFCFFSIVLNPTHSYLKRVFYIILLINDYK